jgi:hypothetical protein
MGSGPAGEYGEIAGSLGVAWVVKLEQVCELLQRGFTRQKGGSSRAAGRMRCEMRSSAEEALLEMLVLLRDEGTTPSYVAAPGAGGTRVAGGFLKSAWGYAANAVLGLQENYPSHSLGLCVAALQLVVLGVGCVTASKGCL